MRTFEYRIYPNKAQAKALMTCLIASRHLYNEMLAASKAHYDESGTFLLKYDLTARFRGRGGEYVPASTVQMLADRLDKAFKASWGAFLDILEDKAERAGHQVIRVNPCFTTQACSHSGELIHRAKIVHTP